jgi:ABC-type antimicrobial peptide transport system ATPase subunit
MKNYIPLLLSLVCASAYAIEMPTKIRLYNTLNDAQQQQNASYITVDLGLNTTKNHVRDELLRELGCGHLMEGTVESFSADPNSNIPLRTLYRTRAQARRALEENFSYWRFNPEEK